MTLGTNNMETSQSRNALAEHDICTAACHISSNCYSAELSGTSYDFGFLLMELGIQDSMGNSTFFQNTG